MPFLQTFRCQKGQLVSLHRVSMNVKKQEIMSDEPGNLIDIEFQQTVFTSNKQINIFSHSGLFGIRPAI